MFKTRLEDRKLEDLDGWVSIKCGLFPFQLQNKKWCEDTLRRLVNEANVSLPFLPSLPRELVEVLASRFTSQTSSVSNAFI